MTDALRAPLIQLRDEINERLKVLAHDGVNGLASIEVAKVRARVDALILALPESEWQPIDPPQEEPDR